LEKHFVVGTMMSLSPFAVVSSLKFPKFLPETDDSTSVATTLPSFHQISNFLISVVVQATTTELRSDLLNQIHAKGLVKYFIGAFYSILFFRKNCVS
jgi:hypothetical protein